MYLVTKENIQSILLTGENSTVEFKSKPRGQNKILPKIISAFANAEGGIIVLGYDEVHKEIIGTSANDLKFINNVILRNNLENICSTYTVDFEEKILIIVEVKKSEELVIVDGSAYIRKGDHSSILSGSDIVARIESTIATPESTISKETLNMVQKIYEEMQEAKEKHKKELRNSKIGNWFFCILSAVIGYALGKFF